MQQASGQSLLIGYPSIEIHCRPHVKKILQYFLIACENGEQILRVNHWYGALLKRMLRKHNPDYDYSKLTSHYSTTFKLFISESDMQQFGSCLSPEDTVLFNETVDKSFEFALFQLVNRYRAEGLTEQNAVLKALAWHGLTDDDYSDTAAHSAVYRHGKKFEK